MLFAGSLKEKIDTIELETVSTLYVFPSISTKCMRVDEPKA
jgi:hypothetical protein